MLCLDIDQEMQYSYSVTLPPPPHKPTLKREIQ